jgi:hypothetical protein
MMPTIPPITPPTMVPLYFYYYQEMPGGHEFGTNVRRLTSEDMMGTENEFVSFRMQKQGMSYVVAGLE